MVKDGVSPMILPLPGQPVIIPKDTNVSQIQITCDHHTSMLYLLAGTQMVQFNMDGWIQKFYSLPAECSRFTVSKNKMFLSQKYREADLIVMDWNRHEIQYMKQAVPTWTRGICVRQDGYMALCDYYHDKINIQKPDGTLDCVLGKIGREDGELMTPIDIQCSSHQEWIVAEFNGSRIQVFDRMGQFIRTLGTKTNCFSPISLAVDREDNVYVLLFNSKQLHVFRLCDGVYVTEIHLTTSALSNVDCYADSICIDCEGRVLVVTTDGRVHALGFE